MVHKYGAPVGLSWGSSSHGFCFFIFIIDHLQKDRSSTSDWPRYRERKAKSIWLGRRYQNNIYFKVALEVVYACIIVSIAYEERRIEAASPQTAIGPSLVSSLRVVFGERYCVNTRETERHESSKIETFKK